MKRARDFEHSLPMNSGGFGKDITNRGGAGRVKICGKGYISGDAPRNPMRKAGRHESAPRASAGQEARRETLLRSRRVCRCCVRRRRRAVHDMQPYYITRPKTTALRCWSPTILGLDAFFSRLSLSGDSIPRRRKEAWCGPADNGVGGSSALERRQR